MRNHLWRILLVAAASATLPVTATAAQEPAGTGHIRIAGDLTTSDTLNVVACARRLPGSSGNQGGLLIEFLGGNVMGTSQVHLQLPDYQSDGQLHERALPGQTPLYVMHAGWGPGQLAPGNATELTATISGGGALGKATFRNLPFTIGAKTALTSGTLTWHCKTVTTE